MNQSRSVLWSLATVVLAALVSFGVARYAIRDAMPEGDSSEQTFHAWLHDNLSITAEQEQRLLPHEEAFEKDRDRLRRDIKEAGRKLALAIREHEADSDEVKLARENLVRFQGELQQATLDHFFAMKEFLTPEQGEKLLEWTHDSIIHGRPD